jgi:hypothetical protein
MEKEPQLPESDKEATDHSSKSLARFRLAYGYICPADPDSKKDKASAAAPSPLLPLSTVPGGEEREEGEDALASAAVKKSNRSQAFWFHSRRLQDPILLYGNQVARLIDELPAAYAAVEKKQQDYVFLLSESQFNKITLEVSLYRDKYYLFLKKYFKGTPGHRRSNPSAVAADRATWLALSAVGFDPVKDDPEAILDFVLSIRQRF